MTTKQALIALALSALACTSGENGTETGTPPVIDFHNSGCKGHASSGLTLQSLDDPARGSLYDGLTCFVWQRTSDDELQIELTNYESSCGSESGWTPQVEQAADGALELVLHDRDCSQARCGWCIYDLSFTVKHEAIASTDREVRLYQRGCGEERRQGKRAYLPLASQASGAVCNYAHSSALTWTQQPQGHGAHTLCGDGGPSGRDNKCDDGFTCTTLPSPSASDFSGGDRCLANCQSDAECDALNHCDQSVCRLRVIGLQSDVATESE